MRGNSVADEDSLFWNNKQLVRVIEMLVERKMVSLLEKDALASVHSIDGVVRRLEELEEWRMEVLSAETLGLEGDFQKQRVLPVKYYVSTGELSVAYEVED